MSSTNNLNIEYFYELPSPGDLRSELPLTPRQELQVTSDRQSVMDILDGKSSRLLMIVGPCSIHNIDAALEYAERLRRVQNRVGDRIFIIMRSYFEKPRTTLGWKGIVYDPDLSGSYEVVRGLRTARRLLLRLIDLGLPAATEMLDPITAQYFADGISWAAIGARTTEAQTHRQLSSGLSMPVGFKNATDGTLQTAIDAVVTSRSRHCFLGVQENGHVGVFHTSGNPYAHIVLRGGNSGPNFDPEHIAFAKAALQRVGGLEARIIVDCSHGNSCKDFHRQRLVLDNVLDLLAAGESAIRGVMLESNLQEGRQTIHPGIPVAPGVSITDGCIGWSETEELIEMTYNKLKRID